MYTNCFQRFALCWVTGLLLLGVAASAAEEKGDQRRFGTEGREALEESFRQEQGWLKVHAAEALVLEGDSAAVKKFLVEEPPAYGIALPRIGRWRLQARLAESDGERDRAPRQVEAVFLDPAGPADRMQAIETLCKLRATSSSAVADGARRLAGQGAERDRVFANWFLALAGEVAAADRVAEALESDDAVARLRAGYVLRWLGEVRAGPLARLTAAADREPHDSVAQIYLVAAAYSLKADPARVPAWRVGLLAHVDEGDAGARFEAAQVLMGQLTTEELAAWRGWLHQAGDSRIAAGWLLLHGANGAR